MSEVWVVDDDQSMRWVLERSLTKDGLSVESFSTPREALARLQVSRPRVILSDIRMPGMTGLEFLEELKARGLQVPVIVMTAYSDLDSAVSSFQGGAYEYLAKPFDLPVATNLVRRALAEGEVVSVPAADLENPPELLGQAPAMQEVFRAIGRLANSSATVLVTGESGTGKELIARALHNHSPRQREAFVALNTAAIPRDLLESELFGHERGAFTGAQQQRRGRFEQAEGGTLFLDEIGDMPAELQTRLLRVLSDGHFYRVGGHQPIRSNVRVIAATHQNLEQRVALGQFREDLFHRLNVIRLRLPPLRERREDVELLMKHFLRMSARQLNVEPKRLSAAALVHLQNFNWPGNVRQLENLCHWLNVMTPGPVADIADLPPEIRSAHSPTDNPLAARSVNAGQSITAASGHFAVPSGPLTTHVAPQSATSDAMSSQAAASHTAGAQTALSHSTSLQSATTASATPATATPQWGANPTTPVDPMILAESEAWLEPLRRLLAARLEQQPRDVEQMVPSDLMDQLTRCFEANLISVALKHTRGRRIEAALRLGIGRNTITRKIQEMDLKN